MAKNASGKLRWGLTIVTSAHVSRTSDSLESRNKSFAKAGVPPNLLAKIKVQNLTHTYSPGN
jgi:hypothetical protein